MLRGWKSKLVCIGSWACMPYLIISSLIIFGAGPTVPDRWDAFLNVNLGIFFLYSALLSILAIATGIEKALFLFMQSYRQNTIPPHGYIISAHRNKIPGDKWAAYLKLAQPAIEAKGGSFLSTGEKLIATGHELPGNTDLIKFTSLDAAIAAYKSTEYQKALSVLLGEDGNDIRIIEGV